MNKIILFGLGALAILLAGTYIGKTFFPSYSGATRRPSPSTQNEQVLSGATAVPVAVSMYMGVPKFETIAGADDMLVMFGDRFDAIPNPKTGKVGWNVPSFNHVIETQSKWKGKIDVILYDYEMWEKTPEEEKRNPAWASQRAQEFCNANGIMLIQGVSWKTITTRRGASSVYGKIDKVKVQTIAKYVDNLGLNATGLRREYGQAYVDWVKEAVGYAKEVNADIKIWPVLDPRSQTVSEMYDMYTQLRASMDVGGITLMGGKKEAKTIAEFIHKIRAN